MTRAALTYHSILQALFGATNGPGQGGARGGNGVPDLGAIIATLMAPGYDRAGDAVYTQEAFDQVLTQLMDQTQGSTAPPPASDEAINALPKKIVTADMMGNDGKVECSICMDDCPIGTEVTALPCDHWFHDECIEKWLKTSDTCPHCRKPISDHIEDPQTRPLRPGQPRGSRSSAGGRRPSSVSSPRASAPGDGSRGNPFTLPDSPSALREARQDFYARRDGSSRDQDRSRSHRSSSTQGTPRPTDARQASSSSNAGGGPMGWVRNHMPFGS
jgi:E3 ubiquitin-protein ligase RNF115/126